MKVYRIQDRHYTHLLISLNEDVPDIEALGLDTVRFYVISESGNFIIFFGTFISAEVLWEACEAITLEAYGLYGEARTISIHGFGIAPNFPSLYTEIELLPWCWNAEYPDSVLAKSVTDLYIKHYIETAIPLSDRAQIYNLLCKIDSIN